MIPFLRLSRMLFLVLLGTAGGAFGADAPAYPAKKPITPSGERAAPVIRTIQLELEVANATDRLLEGAEVGILAPVAESAGQRCCEALTSNLPNEVVRGPQGNQALRFRLDRLPPYAIRYIRVRAQLQIFDAPAVVDEPNGVRWLRSEPLVEVNHVKIREQARRLRAKEPFETAKNTFDWVTDNVSYTGYLRDARGALYALEQQRGDCTEYMHLLVALARANGIPARGMGGYVVARDGVVRAHAFHNWAELYLDGAWRIADAQRKRFDAGYGRYIATRILGGDEGPIPRTANRFWNVGDELRMKMR